MALHGKLLQQQLVLLLLIIGVQLVLAALTQQQPNNPSCNRTCGSFNIPYPFGTHEGCYLDPSFLIICNHSFKPPKPFLGVDNIDVLNISLDGELRVSNLVVRRCDWYPLYDNHPSFRRLSALLNLLSFSISHTKNSIFAVGCNHFAYLKGSKGHENEYHMFIAGCTLFCDNGTHNLVNGSCSGLGCCHSALPKGETNYNLTLVSFYNGLSNITQSCGLGFIGETEAYNFSPLDFENLSNPNAVTPQSVPLVLDWAIGNKKCKDAQKNMTSYLCNSRYSQCNDSSNGHGYICKCYPGYKGNPYLPDGQDDSCQDIDECKDRPNPCNATHATCTNTNGSYTCTCPKGYEGDGRMPPGTGCSRKLGQSKIIIIALELLTGEKAVSMFRPESERNLAIYFETAVKEDRLLQIIDDRILKEGNIEEITEVANIANNCLKVRGEDRPSMKQVTKELEELRLSEKHSLKKVDSNTQQTKHLPNASTQSLAIDFDIGSSSISTTIVGDDSMRNQVLKPTDNDVR